ncbi:MAG TPA: hypothetical protein VJT73_07370 [Polyangiaceae bacterium]|nr:hypothetical protein [Polyangiaceae bacterium]
MQKKHGGKGSHFEGWELGLVAVTIALFGTLLAVPLRVEPTEIPVPIADAKLVSRSREHDRALAAEIEPALAREVTNVAQGTELFDLRALGEAFRRYGAIESDGDGRDATRARQSLLEATERARAFGENRLVALRAFQLERFLRALHRWEGTGQQSEDLVGLGGPFLSLLSRNGWVKGRIIAMDDAVRATFFKRRWNELTGLTQPSFALSLDEYRVFFGFLLTHPNLVPAKGSSAADICRTADLWRLKKVDELGRIDPMFPTSLALGVLYFRLGRYAAAAQAFRDHLALGPDQPYALKAQNYLAAAVARAGAEPQ